uniref:PEHE domain-containing protein n=1 Tax=Graphocephala atropunctata TaxID=36148 RepID=A0A1B6LFQ2_9HEMI
MSKSGVILNGENTSDVKDYTSDANVNMGAAINDNSCSKHLETFNSKDNKAGLIPYPCDFDHIYASNMSESENSGDKNSEIMHLKELLLLHLDLIQQQSEQLVTKDKQITALKQENDTLKLRLERMDRRVTLQKHKELSEVITTSNQLPDAEVDDIASTTDLIVNQESETLLTPVATAQDSNHIVRRRRRDDKLSVSGSVWSASGPKRRNRSLSWTSSVTSTDATSTTKVNGGKLIKRERHQRRERTRKKRSKKEDSFEKRDETILTTDSPYYTPVGDANNLWNPEEIPVSGCVLEVPSWRVKVFTSCYTMEGTENLSDDVFDRRHSRLEIDERRRKRWDVQRIREQRQLEKLRQRGRKRSGGGDGEELLSLWPSPDQAQYLQIQDSLPVAAFGYPITKLNPVDSEFTLPWVNGRDFGRSRPSYISRKKR